LESHEIKDSKHLSELATGSLMNIIDKRVNNDRSQNNQNQIRQARWGIAGAAAGFAVREVVQHYSHGLLGNGSGRKTGALQEESGSIDSTNSIVPTAIETVPSASTSDTIPQAGSSTTTSVPETTTGASTEEVTPSPSDPTERPESSVLDASAEEALPSADDDSIVTPAEETVLGKTTPVSPEVEQVDTSTLKVLDGKGFEDSIQSQYGLSDAQSHEAFMAMKPHLANQEGIYGDYLISAPGDMTLNPQAAHALQQYLLSLESDELNELPQAA